MVWLTSKSCFTYYILVILAFSLTTLFLFMQRVSWYEQPLSPPLGSFSLNYQCNTSVRSRCDHSVTSSCCAIVLTKSVGRLGNRMFMFASALGIALTYSCQLAIDEKIIDELKTVFKIDLRQIYGLQLIELMNIRSCVDRNDNYCNYFPVIFEKNRYHVIELTGFWQSYRFFDKYRKVIRSQFVFQDSIKHKIAQFFREEEYKHINRSIKLYRNQKSIDKSKINSQTLSSTWVGIHIRRGDFLYLRQVSSTRFIIEAMSYFEKKYFNVIFLITSDDKTFCKEMYGNISNVVITPVAFSTGEDLAALTTCHHMIVTVGTFGWWAGFLIHGEVLHDVKFSKSPTPVDNNCTHINYLPPSFSFFNKTF